MDAPLWPARNVGEYDYCPRLFYYMEVEGIHVASHDTEEGQRIHRRVDGPSKAPAVDEVDPHAPRQVRSLTLTNPELGLTATLDLAEVTGNVAVPVEYRKGRPRRLYGLENGNGEGSGNGDVCGVEPWPTDRVQVGLQAILLESAGYEVPRAILYYAAERRRVEVTVDDALRRDALETLAAAKSCATGPRPLPLVNDPRCPRCSLQAVCLPDEINVQRDSTGASARIWRNRNPTARKAAVTLGESLDEPLEGMVVI